MTSIVAVVNPKGGVAKTTTAVSLGGALAEKGREVLLVDLDPQQNLTQALGFDPKKTRNSITDVLTSWASITSVSQQTRVAGLDLVPSDNSMQLAERFLPIRKNYEAILRNALTQPTLYDFIILDCPPACGAITFNAINAAHLLIVPSLPEVFSLYSLSSLLLVINRARSESNPQLHYRILLTLFDVRLRIHCEIRECICREFKDNVFGSIIQVDTKLRESIIAGLPITHYEPDSRGAHQYRAFAKELLDYVQENGLGAV